MSDLVLHALRSLLSVIRAALAGNRSLNNRQCPCSHVLHERLMKGATLQHVAGRRRMHGAPCKQSMPCLAPQVEVLVHVVSALFDMNPSMATHMAPPLWRRCVGVLLEVLQTLGDHPNIIMDEHYEAGAEERCVAPT